MKLGITGGNEVDIRKVTNALSMLEQDQAYFIRIEKVKKIRTLSQERYYRGVVVKIISDETGYEPSETHDVLKEMFAEKREIMLPNGKKIQIPLSNADMDTKQYSGYVDACRNWAAQELNCFIPAPDDITNEMYEEISKRKYV